MEKISANSDTRLRVKPQAQEANSVIVRVRITAAPTITASRQPKANRTSPITSPVAKISLVIRVIALSLAVTP